MPPTPGYHNCILRIDVSSGESRRVPISGEILRQYLGGSGLGVYLLLAEGAAESNPLGPDAAIAFVFSPLVGSPLTTSAKFAVVSKSPLTGRINDSLASSGFALAGKRSGCDAIVLVGRAAVPSVLVIDEDSVQIIPAGTAWGMDIPEAEADLRSRLRTSFGDGFQTAVIGPAGERLIRFATISHDGRHAGRGGSGAVLGSKNIKAIAVRGLKKVEWAKPEALVTYAKELSRRSFGPATAKYRELGTAANLLVFNRLAALPTRNFQRGTFDGAQALSPEQMATTRKKTRTSCAACTIGCEHIYSIVQNPNRAETANSDLPDQGVRIEYESLFALGPLCEVDDPDAVLRASKRCDALGLDTISTGGTIAFAMECAEKGLIDAPWLRFGDGRALEQAVDLIVTRRGIGELLAEGSRRMAHRVGGRSIDFAPQVKGLEIPGYEPRALQSMALGFAVGARGADHNRSGAYEADFSDRVDRRALTPQDVHFAIDTEDRAAILDSAILCKFLRGVFDDFYGDVSEILGLVTGWEIDATELRSIARRIIDVKKEFNIRAGWTPDEDTLPSRFLTAKLPDDERAVLSADRLQELVRAYNRARGWTDDGQFQRLP